MKRRSFIKRAGTASLVTLITPAGIVQALQPIAEGSLEQSFLNPPGIARPFTWWHWMNGNISKKGITLDLEALKRVGVGGVQCFNVGNAIPKGPVDYLSPKWLELTKHAMNEAGRLGLQFDMHNCPGWSSTGGPWITPELGMQQVVWSQTFITGGGTETPVSLPQPSATKGFYRDTYVVAYPTLEGEEQGKIYITDDFRNKANFPLKGAAKNPFIKGRTVSAGIKLQPGSFIDPSTVTDISSHMDKNGSLKWKAPEGKWTVLRLGHTLIERENRAAPDSGIGLECDKFSRKAYEFHFDNLFDNLMPVVQQWTGKSKIGLLVDSYEVGLQNWTPSLPQEFEKRRGYDLISYLPAITGRIVGNSDTTERFLWDFRRTHADLMADNYYGHFAELCKKNGIVSYTEPYRNGPFDQMQAGSKVDIVMGEFWIRGPHFLPSLKLTSSIAHVYGKRTDGRQIVGAESFTGDPTHSKWQEYPYSLKAQGDLMFTQGLNRFIFHRYAHQPHTTAKPGMTMGQFGFHFDRTNTWFEQSKSWLTYSSRCQSILQQGLFCADILYFTGENVPANDLSRLPEPNPAPPEGYGWDWVNKEVLITRMSIRDNVIVMPDGLNYKILALVPQKEMTLEVLQKIRELVNKGMVLVGDPPERTPGLNGHQKNDAALKTIVRELWGDAPAPERKVGAGKVFPYQPLKQVVEKLNIRPDFEFTSRSGDAIVNYIHRTVEGGEVYFIANRRRSKEDLIATFRVSGKQPELWDAATGEISSLEVYDQAEGRTVVPLQLDPSGSCFIVFRSPAAVKCITAIEKDGAELVSARDFPIPKPGRYRDITNNFTVTAWVKPESIDVFSGEFGPRGACSFLFYPPAGELLYGKGHAACGMVVARNGLIVYERTVEKLAIGINIEMPISGWTHIALVYKEGLPSIYVNGKFIKEGKSSGQIVHPGVGDFKQDENAWLFEGDISELQVVNEVLSEEQIRQLTSKEVGAPDAPGSIQLSSGKMGLLFWEDGKYILHTSENKKLETKMSGIGKPGLLSGGWTVSFPPNLGAPATAVLPELISLHKHKQDGIKYFSGTAAYTKEFAVSADALGEDKRLFIDLGRVEVIAEVKVNGKDLGILWKTPYMVEVTGAVKSGKNTLEVKVTNLWPNRLIGDEYLPEENEHIPGMATTGGGIEGAIKVLPDWYIQDKPKPAGGRVAFTTWKHYTKDSPLLESGLIGPVVLRAALQHQIT